MQVIDKALSIIVDIEPRASSKAICTGCKKPAPGYDRKPTPRLFHFVALWSIPVIFSYRPRRVNCTPCGGIKTELLPWADGKHTCCNVYRAFLAGWAKHLSWSQTARSFKTSWDTVRRSVEWVVDFGLEHKDLKGVSAIGVDEVAYSAGHRYMTLVYQINSGSKRLLGVIKDRDTSALTTFLEESGKPFRDGIRIVCSDMWKPYLNVIANMLPNALNILDRFHIAKKLGEAVDAVRRNETRELKAGGFMPVLNKSRYCFLKRPENLSKSQKSKLVDVLKYNLKTVRAYFLKESFDAFWNYNSPRWATWFLHKWCARVMRSRLAPMKKFVATLRSHEDLLMNYFKANKLYSSGIVEGLNLRVNLTMRKSYGYRSFDLLKTSLFHTLGDLPEPKFTHSFF